MKRLSGMRSIICEFTQFQQDTCIRMNLNDETHRADYMNDEEIQEHIAWKSAFASGEKIEFTDEENAVMLKLPRKECS